MEFGPSDDPLDVLARFRQRAESSGQPIPEAMALATVGEDGGPRARMVLWRGQRGREIHFFTNYESDKSKELERTPRAALLFHYAALELQARVEGSVVRLAPHESDVYFATRPRESQIGAWASAQSRPISSRVELEARVREVEERYGGREIPRPPYWGGFAVLAERVELWSGRVGRLHHRARYVFGPHGSWEYTLLQP